MAIHELFACMRVKDSGAAIDFYTRVFGVTEKFRLVEPSGRIGHAELDFKGATLMLSDEFPEYGMLAPQARCAGCAEPASACGQLRRGDRTGLAGRRHPGDGGSRPVLRRTLGQLHRPLRSPLERGPPHRGCQHRRNAAPLYRHDEFSHHINAIKLVAACAQPLWAVAHFLMQVGARFKLAACPADQAGAARSAAIRRSMSET